MKMMVIVLLVVATSAAAGWSDFRVDVQQEEMYPKEMRPADHLTPSQEWFPETYYLIEFAEFPALEGQRWLIRVSLNSNKTSAIIDLYTNAMPLVSNSDKTKLGLRFSEITRHPHASRDLDLKTATVLYRT